MTHSKKDNMKSAKFANLVVIALALTFAVAGCKKKPGYVTPLPPGMTQNPSDIGGGGALKPGGLESDKIGSEGIKANEPGSHAGWAENRGTFASDIVYFDFDSSVIKSSERSKIQNIADHLKANGAEAVRVEGNCDERGTEEYNRALGERRALALREELVRLGIDATRIDTISYGEDKPAVPGHDEAAWKMNRRDESVLLSPPK